MITRGTAAEIKFILKPVVQDWTAFKVALRASGISEDSKKSFLNIVNGSGSFEDKEKAMRKISRLQNGVRQSLSILEDCSN